VCVNLARMRAGYRRTHLTRRRGPTLDGIFHSKARLGPEI
jgi:hypothetical protein